MRKLILLAPLLLAACADMVPAQCTDARGTTFQGDAIVNGNTVIEYRIKDNNGFERTISEGISEYYDCKILKRVGEAEEPKSTLPSEPKE